MKVFQVSNCDTVAAETLEEAVAKYKSGGGCEPDPDLADEAAEFVPYEISEELLKKQTFFDESTGYCGPSWEYLQILIRSGRPFPCFFGCSEI